MQERIKIPELFVGWHKLGLPLKLQIELKKFSFLWRNSLDLLIRVLELFSSTLIILNEL